MPTLVHSQAILDSPVAERKQNITYAEKELSTSPYSQLATWTTQQMNSVPFNLKVSARELAPSVSNRVSSNQRFQLQASAWTIQRTNLPLCEARMVLIQGSSNTIINTWIFPYCSGQHPVFAAELIAIAGSPKLTFLDIQVPGATVNTVKIVKQITGPVQTKYQHLQTDEVPPFWAIDATAGNYIFGRKSSVETMTCIQKCYQELFLGYFEILDTTTHSESYDIDDTIAKQVLHAYQLHHMEHSPGQNFLGKVFGDDWTRSFLTDFLFSPPGA